MHTVAILAHVAASWHAGNKSGMCPGVLFPDISYAHKVAEAATLALTCIFLEKWRPGFLYRIRFPSGRSVALA